MWFTCFLKYFSIAFAILTVIRWVLRRKWGSVDKSNEISAKGKIVLITGANAGIGKATALEFAQRDANVILACRNLEKAKEAVAWIRSKTTLGQLICMQLDLASFESIKKFSKEFKSKYERLDILVNNAGVLVPPAERRKTADGHEIHMGVNHLGHFLLTNLLLDPLKKASPSRIVNVSSMAHKWGSIDFDDLMCDKKLVRGNSVANVLYANSKLANALFNKELARRLEGSGVRCYALCPGMVITELGQNLSGPLLWMLQLISPIARYLLKSAQEGAATTMYCALSKNLINESGNMYTSCSEWPEASRVPLKDADARRLWDESAKLVGI